MPVRKLTRVGTGESGGDADAVSGGTPIPPGAGKDQGRQQPHGGELPFDAMTAALIGEEIRSAGRQEPAAELYFPVDEIVGAVLDGYPNRTEAREQEAPQKDAPQARVAQPPAAPVPRAYSPDRLQRAAAEVITELHAAKQELAQELEANLKQLKAVLKETQRIAKDMEAVLGEAKAEPKQDDLAQKDGSGGGGGKGKQQPWEPPGLKKSAKQQQDGQVDWESADADQEQEQGQQKQKRQPAWEPPQDALH